MLAACTLWPSHMEPESHGSRAAHHSHEARRALGSDRSRPAGPRGGLATASNISLTCRRSIGRARPHGYPARADTAIATSPLSWAPSKTSQWRSPAFQIAPPISPCSPIRSPPSGSCPTRRRSAGRATVTTPRPVHTAGRQQVPGSIRPFSIDTAFTGGPSYRACLHTGSRPSHHPSRNPATSPERSRRRARCAAALADPSGPAIRSRCTVERDPRSKF